jgi:hypothetical protein
LLLLRGRRVYGHVELTYQTFDVEHMLPRFFQGFISSGFYLHLFANVVSVDSVLQMFCALRYIIGAFEVFSFSPILWEIVLD